MQTVLRSPVVTPTPRSSGRSTRASGSRVLAALLGLALGLPDVARAEDPPSSALPTVHDEPEAPAASTPANADDLQRAMAAFARGSDNYNGAKYQAALSDFLEAASLYASPDFQYNIGLCYEKLGKPEEAIGAFETYLKTKRDVPDRANVEDRIKRLREELDRRANAAANPATPAVTPDDTPPRDRSKPLVIAGAAVIAVGAAVAIGGGLGLGLAAKRKSDDLDAVQKGGNPDDLTFAQASDLEDEGKKLELGQIVTVAVGGAIALAGVALLAVGLSRRKKAAARKAAFAPSFGRQAIGLSISGRF